ncbi:MAG: hypothetical protein ACK5N8_05005 [Alphaproteobacteria bacterium]
MENLFKQIVAWHLETFPDIVAEKQKEKLDEERQEFAIATTPQEKLDELADVYIVNAGLSRFYPEESMQNIIQIRKDLQSLNFTFFVLKGAVEKKLEENKKRTWHIAGGEYPHVGDAQ